MRGASFLGLGAAASLFLASGAAFADPPPAAPAPGAAPPGAIVVVVPSGYAPPGQPGYPQPGYAQPGYPPPGYGPPPPGYAQPGYPPGYGPPPPGYAQPGHPPPGYVLAPGYWPPPGYGPQPMQPPAATERRSTGMMVGGIVLLSVGGLGLVIGSSLALSSTTTCDFGGCSSSGGSQTAGYGVLIGGAIAVAVGIPLLIYGVKKVPARPDATAPAAAAWVGAPGGAGWSWQF